MFLNHTGVIWGQGVTSWRGIIHGEAASKANSREVKMIGGRKLFVRSAKAYGFARDALWQVPVLPVLLQGPLRFTCNIFYRTERPDLDESILLDALQSRIYANDRQIRQKHVYHAIDRANPRVEVMVEELGAAAELAPIFPDGPARGAATRIAEANGSTRIGQPLVPAR